jgi:hypothetical protein
VGGQAPPPWGGTRSSTRVVDGRSDISDAAAEALSQSRRCRGASVCRPQQLPHVQVATGRPDGPIGVDQRPTPKGMTDPAASRVVVLAKLGAAVVAGALLAGVLLPFVAGTGVVEVPLAQGVFRRSATPVSPASAFMRRS